MRRKSRSHVNISSLAATSYCGSVSSHWQLELQASCGRQAWGFSQSQFYILLPSKCILSFRNINSKILHSFLILEVVPKFWVSSLLNVMVAVRILIQNGNLGWLWYHTPVTPARERLRQKAHWEVKARLGHTVRLCLDGWIHGLMGRQIDLEGWPSTRLRRVFARFPLTCLKSSLTSSISPSPAPQ